MSEQIYIFNPEHDLCVANGDENFEPPRSAAGFAKENTDLSEYLKRPNKQSRQIIPWGWNHSLKKRLINEGIDFIYPSIRRRTAVHTHSLQKRVCLGCAFTPMLRRFTGHRARLQEHYLECQ